MKPKPPKGWRVFDAPVAWTLSFVAWLVRLLPVGMALRLGGGLGWLLGALGKRRRKRVEDQIRLVYGSRVSDDERRHLAMESYRHLGIGLVETMILPKITSKNLHRFWKLDEVRELLDLFQDGGLLVTGHVGAYPIASHAFSLLEPGRIYAVQRPIDHPGAHRVIDGLRSSGGLKLISKFESFTEVRKALREKSMVCLIVDQNGGGRGVFVDFLGWPASSWSSAAELQELLKVRIVVASCYREGIGPMNRIVVHEVLDHEPLPEGLDKAARKAIIEQRVVKTTAKIHHGIGQAVLAHPEQWMWQHRRWKTRPPGETIPLVDGVPSPWLGGDRAVI